MRIIIVAGALLGSASALAQTAEPATTPSDASAPAASTAADPSAAATGAPTAEPAASASATTQASSTGTVDIAAHDADKDGSLSPLEFAQHLNATSGDASLSAEARRERYSRASGNGAIKLLNSTADEFGAADRNRDRRIDTTELATWQSGGMSASASAATSTPIASGAGSTTPAPDTSATMTPSTTAEPPATEPPAGASTRGSTAITSGAGSASPAPDSGTTMDTPAPNEGTRPTDPPSNDSSDDMQNSTDPNESTTTPPTR